AAVLLSLAAPGAAADRVLAWRVLGSDGRGRAVCQDGDARCDRDGTADGACTFGVALCLDGAAAVRVRGAGAAALTQALAARAAGERVYIVNRFLGDNLQVLDPAHGLATLLQCSTGPGSNPHDVAVLAPDKAYVTRYDAKELWIVDPSAASCAGFLRDTVDLSPWGDADGIPEMDQMALVGDRLFVSLERLDRTRRFAPAGRSRLVVLDTASDTVVGVVELSGANAFGDSSGLAREPGSGKLVVNEAGDIQRTGDRGLERVDPFTL